MAAWTGWCPECFTGPLVLNNAGKIPAHRYPQNERQCSGWGQKPVTFDQIRAGIKAAMYG